MYITKKSLPRRLVLRSLGASVALPLLDSMVPAAVPLRKLPILTRPRLVAIEMVHGAAGSAPWGRENHYWSPAGDGPDFAFTPTLEPLTPLRQYITIISNTELRNAASLSDDEDGPMADHARSSAAFLTAAHPKLASGPDIFVGPSLDQIVARRFARETRVPSLQLCVEDLDSFAGDCGHGYSCAYTNTISWASPTEPLRMERAPRAIFARVFAAGCAGESPPCASILDGLVNPTRRLKNTLGPADRRRLNDYLEEIRVVEQRIQDIERENATRASQAGAPLSVPDSFEPHLQLLWRLQVLAFEADVTRVCTLKMGLDRSPRIYPESGVTTAFHALSHHRETPEKIQEFARLNQYHVGRVSEFLNLLRNTPDGDGNLLDHSVVLYGSPMGDSHIHEHKYLPVFLAGHASGQIKGNTHVQCAPGTPMANILLTLARRLGVDLDRIGDSTGEIAI